MFRASICPSSGVACASLACLAQENLIYVCPCIIYEIDERYPLDATIYYSWRWAYRCPKHVELFIIINKLLHQVGISRQFHIRCTDTHTSNDIQLVQLLVVWYLVNLLLYSLFDGLCWTTWRWPDSRSETCSCYILHSIIYGVVILFY